MSPAREILRMPPRDGSTRIEAYLAYLAEHGGPRFTEYGELWEWSVTELDAFWLSVWRFFEIPSDTGPTVALADDRMPGARWFPEVALNYAETLLRMPGRADDDIVVVARSQSRDDVELTAAQLRDQVARARAGLVRAGVGRGDRVAAYAPNIPETLVLMLAAASLGAAFSSCAPEFGFLSVVDRWKQIQPSIVLAVDGYGYGGKPIDRRAEVAAILAELPGEPRLVWLPYLDPEAPVPDGGIHWRDFLAQPAAPAFDRLPFDAPLYILFSSGTTGLPKPIVHGHGGITIEHLKALGLQFDLGPDDRYFWYSTTSWVMWNFLVSGLMVGASIVLFDGDPAAPDAGMLWRAAGELGLTYFGTSAPFLLRCRREGIRPSAIADLSALRGVGSTGAPLPPEGFRWVYRTIGPDVALSSVSGGTDVATGFVGGIPILPVYAGQIPARLLGCAVEAFDAKGRTVIGEVGELVVTRPMPSMPVGFWNDDGTRYRAAYFEEFPGVWRHGDWIVIGSDGTCAITGRSDATLNRGGVRLGTAEFYAVVEDIPGVADSLVVHLEDREGGAGRLMLFVATDGRPLDEEMVHSIRAALGSRLSPRHVPDDTIGVDALPRTLTGKRLEVPVKKILRGSPIGEVVARGAITNPDALDAFVRFRPDVH
jgi:acetoacetyl-CoA synthetase